VVTSLSNYLSHTRTSATRVPMWYLPHTRTSATSVPMWYLPQTRTSSTRIDFPDSLRILVWVTNSDKS
jgi:hypothetical protein